MITRQELLDLIAKADEEVVPIEEIKFIPEKR